VPYQSTPEDKRRGLGLGIYYLLLAIGLAYMLFVIWPPVPWPDANQEQHREVVARALADCAYPTPSPTPAEKSAQTKAPPVAMPLKFFTKCVMTSFDERLLLLVMVAGILGSFIHGATSLADYVGNETFSRRWTWFYLLRPVIGMALALVFYFVIRGGFLTTNVGATDINPYGIAALAGMVGMFSKQATDKLSEVFSTLFKSGSGEGDEKRSDPLIPKPTPIIVKIDPPEVTAGSESLKITVTGTDFVEGSTIFLGELRQPTTFESATQMSAQVAKATIANEGVIKVTVVNPDSSKSAAVDFKVAKAPPAPPPAPEALTVANVNPATVPAGSNAPKVIVTGAGFVDGSQVLVNDAPQDTTFESAGSISAQLADATIATAGVLKLKVLNPDGSESTTIDFVATE
jgi:hypothetical protein